ncbi:biotin/lipoyl-binding protein [Labilibaculum sp. A4]|uniref:acetyl/propionyl/methylcrotonyl-CoA carboxylase subunit alpha n=1 Tax=Labilibaculum euxinus TaxID=2686357 RepID=UPI000F6199E7|nr:biotin carboxylase N-terminal domain-containing protein [Labilibaculum euxinus]MDQ1770414.1 biotin carboxylase N-terminal domain-containing protein [Labilibaculum euxinus]MWN75366.1 biotin/lipoyl-binding protein [Labilibaculum euxinus]
MYYKRLLIANRGEIALRIMRTARELGIHTIALYTELDRQAEHVLQADEAYPLKGNNLQETYLNLNQIVEIARKAKADAIHPGYGFLAENAVFSQLCVDNGIDFVGPDADAILLMGNKVNAREFAKSIGVPVLEGVVGDSVKLIEEAGKMQFPLLIKAAAGGGGKGMRIVYKKEDLQAALESTSRESTSYFGDGTVLIERYIQNPRHIEVQILADQHGNVVHLFERECSIQRRFQKVIEEAPSPTLTHELRKEMGNMAVFLAQEMNYTNAGTVEFLVDEDLNYYFLEMNTRIQVEHPVTEMITGIDLVEKQLSIASGRKLKLRQEDIHMKGHAIEARIYAEDPENEFIPSPGEISFYKTPKLFDGRLRLDSAIVGACTIHPDYDPMIAKLVVWDENRDLAIEGLHHALHNYEIHGIKNNIMYLHTLLNTDHFKQNKISTHFCQNHNDELMRKMQEDKLEIPAALFQISFVLFELKRKKVNSIWEEIGYWRQQGIKLRIVDKEVLDIEIISKDPYEIKISGVPYVFENVTSGDSQLMLEFNGVRYLFYQSKNTEGKSFVSCQGIVREMMRWSEIQSNIADVGGSDQKEGDGSILSPMPGRVVKIEVNEGQKVAKGDVLIIVEAMKMENSILAPFHGKVENLLVSEGDQVKNRTELMKLMMDLTDQVIY